MTSEAGVVYCVKDPKTGEPKYVGATKQEPESRLHQLIASAPNSEMRDWMDDMDEYEQRPEIEVLERAAVDGLSDIETAYIQEFADKYCLFNVQRRASTTYRDPREQAAPGAYQFSESYHDGDPLGGAIDDPRPAADDAAGARFPSHNPWGSTVEDALAWAADHEPFTRAELLDEFGDQTDIKPESLWKRHVRPALKEAGFESDRTGGRATWSRSREDSDE